MNVSLKHFSDLKLVLLLILFICLGSKTSIEDDKISLGGKKSL